MCCEARRFTLFASRHRFRGIAEATIWFPMLTVRRLSASWGASIIVFYGCFLLLEYFFAKGESSKIGFFLLKVFGSSKAEGWVLRAKDLLSVEMLKDVGFPWCILIWRWEGPIRAGLMSCRERDWQIWRDEDFCLMFQECVSFELPFMHSWLESLWLKT